MPSDDERPPIRDTPQYRNIQNDERFQGWLRMQEAAMVIEFTNFDVPELNGHLYTREGLVIAEREILKRYASFRDMFSEHNLKTGMRFVYFVGETFRRSLEGQWVALPPAPPERPRAASVIDAPMSPAFYDPRRIISLVFKRRTEKEIVTIFDRAVKRYQKWIEDGRPERIS